MTKSKKIKIFNPTVPSKAMNGIFEIKILLKIIH
ncbi:hypothetical protein MsAc7_06060 [Methanolapillus millepedarum]|uniref:Uncharacterized protein n=1 Tax=Methanolapillus millepedarum TaxID=3028296 RepID=A0AA96VEB1_9EURY|nr:hypothetical protein MsAc7_06060 [Methanosarcinaceae archaeon Ac7]